MVCEIKGRVSHPSKDTDHDDPLSFLHPELTSGKSWRKVASCRLKAMDCAAYRRFCAVDVSMEPSVGAESSMNACSPIRIVETDHLGWVVGLWDGG